MHIPELCYCALKIKQKEMYARRSMVTVYFNDSDNTLVGSGQFTYNAYNHSSKVANIMKA